MASRRLPEVLLLAALALSGDAFAQGGGRTIFCCDDAAGRPLCGDVLPAACYGRAYREVSPQGTVRRLIDAPLTPEQAAARRAEERRRQAEEARLLQQRRLDRALLDTYSSVDDIDMRRERALAEVERSIESVHERERELREQRKGLELDAEFYNGQEVPRALSAKLSAVDAELAALRGVVETKQREMALIRQRYAEDRRRYEELRPTRSASQPQ